VDNKAIEVALTALESVELRSLSWGFVDQSLDEGEAEEAITRALDVANITDSADDVLDAMVDAALVRILRDGGGRRYRTRFAELTRLLVRLRQWFAGQSWQSAATLVSDFRLDVRQRRFPRRHIAPVDAWQRIDPERVFTPLQSRLWVALTVSDPLKPLADFQVDATRRLLDADRGTGTIVTAGTGSGKTLAFYLPALLRIAPEVRTGDWWTKVVCLYPRQELLKDQLSEAYGLALRAIDVLKKDGRRPIAIGSFFGPTPFSATAQSIAEAGWRPQADGFICPFLRCPHCDGDMIWPNQALNAQREILRCSRATCGIETPQDTLRLTRRAVQEQPPDLLFSTTEMMNQRLSDTWTRRIFGIGQDSSKVPLLALLDEAHTYSGISGAQTALLLRRWLSLLGTKMRWAGLSATLPNAAQFFSDLTGAWIDNVATIAPSATDMVNEGAEYQIILRSDSASQAATLSTSIQAVMLLSRMLDHPAQRQSAGRIGSKAFVFTDDLDVTHRLFDNLLDAEAYTAWRRPDTTRAPLAALRTSNGPDAVLREREGQRWQLAEDLRGQLSSRLVIGRTTSRDPGVDATANVIVATSSLEVGFNDPDVGAVVQHKAPRSAASFLQRRGRAGRSRDMRPITVLVLSDYGRDRAAFQSYEQLFDPSVEIASLPVRNLYVLRMQAVYATLDWIAIQAPARIAGWSWRVLTGPNSDNRHREFKDHAKGVLQRILQFDSTTIQRLRAHLQNSLSIDNTTLDSILWHPPRSLLLEALPTLARRLFRDWKLAYGNGLDLHQGNPPHPLPDFIPSNLFSDLNLPEVQVALPPPAQDREAMPIVSALQQFAPGRVRRRFADAPGNVSHWVPLNVGVPTQDVSIRNYAPLHVFVGTFNGVRDGVASPVPVYRPWEMQLAAVPRSVSNTSNSRWHWQSSFEALGNPTFIDLPLRASVSDTIQRLEMRLHRFGAGLSVRRFAHSGQASLRINGQDQQIDYRLIDDANQPAAVGFSIESDALIAEINLPRAADIETLALDPRVSRWLRYLALKQRTSISSDLPSTLNTFRRDWLHQVIVLGALVLAARRDTSIESILRELHDQDDPGRFAPFVDALISGAFIPDPDDEDNGGAMVMAVPPTTLGIQLRACLAEPGVLRELIDIALRWTSPVATDWSAWLSELASATIAEAIYMACLTAAPQNAAAEGLTVDVELGADTHRVIIAETTLGGGGTLEALSEVFAAEPRSFVRALESACTPSDHELAADALRRVLPFIVEDPVVAAAMAALRSANETDSRDAARSELFGLLAHRGIPVSRTLSVLLATRLVRPGSNATSDQLMLELIKAWESLEERYGVALPARLAAPAIVLTTNLGPRLAAMGGAGNEILTAQLLLWPTGGELRPKALQSYNPYRPEPYVDSALGRLLLFDLRMPVVEFGSPQWVRHMNEALASHGVVRIVAQPSERAWKAAIIGTLGTPVVSGFLHFYPMVEAIRTLESGHLAIDILLRERV
jgi:hypothetical protein